MDDRNMADLLSAQADRLIEGRHGQAALVTDDADELALLGSLMELAEDVQSALTPVEPNPVFVHRLSRQLPALMVEGTREINRRARRAVLVIAAALGSAVSLISAVGVVIYLLRHRGREARPRALGEM
jgi:hypothetical protein